MKNLTTLKSNLVVAFLAAAVSVGTAHAQDATIVSDALIALAAVAVAIFTAIGTYNIGVWIAQKTAALFSGRR